MFVYVRFKSDVNDQSYVTGTRVCMSCVLVVICLVKRTHIVVCLLTPKMFNFRQSVGEKNNETLTLKFKASIYGA